jgi:hypothetical protein
MKWYRVPDDDRQAQDPAGADSEGDPFSKIRSFHDSATDDVVDGRPTGAAARPCPPGPWNVAGRKLEHMDSVVRLKECK